MATVRDLVTAALREIGVLGAAEVATYDDANDGLTTLNRLVDQWAAERLQVYTETRTTATLTANQASFTVGTGGNINIARPVFIRHVNFIDTSTDPDTEYQLPPLLTEDAWAAIRLKAQTATLPQVAYYNPTYPTGTLWPWPIPTSATLQWVLYHSSAIAQFAGLTTAVSLPPGYERMIVKGLALELLPSYGRQPDAMLIEQARDAKGVVKRSNKRTLDMSVEAGALVQGGRRGAFDIYQG